MCKNAALACYHWKQSCVRTRHRPATSGARSEISNNNETKKHHQKTNRDFVFNTKYITLCCFAAPSRSPVLVDGAYTWDHTVCKQPRQTRTICVFWTVLHIYYHFLSFSLCTFTLIQRDNLRIS